MTKSRSKPYRPPAPSTEQLRALAIQLFDRKDGTGSDWQAMTDCLFRVAFQALDHMEEPARSRMATKVYSAGYERALASDAGSGDGGFSMKKPSSSTPGEGPAPSIRPELLP